jgi:hypothetical protein
MNARRQLRQSPECNSRRPITTIITTTTDGATGTIIITTTIADDQQRGKIAPALERRGLFRAG